MTDDARPPATRFRAVAAYDGTRYHGFQRQAGETLTIQGALETAIAGVTGQTVTVIGAGRTDTGVHATGQVIAFDVEWRHPPEALGRAINAHLPPDIALDAVRRAEPGFHPRFDARSRTYVYSLYGGAVRQPLWMKRAWHVPPALDLAAMQRAADCLVGTHDFAAFGTAPQGENTVREVLSAGVEVRPAVLPGPTEVVQVTIEANAFLYRMARRIVGALVRVGSGALTVAEFEVALHAADPTWPNPAAPAWGLCLTSVRYEGVSGEAPAGAVEE